MVTVTMAELQPPNFLDRSNQASASVKTFVLTSRSTGISLSLAAKWGYEWCFRGSRCAALVDLCCGQRADILIAYLVEVPHSGAAILLKRNCFNEMTRVGHSRNMDFQKLNHVHLYKGSLFI